MNEKQKWILFYMFIGIFLIITGLTIWGVFFKLEYLEEQYKNKLFYALILEISAAVILLFKTGFGLGGDNSVAKKIWIDFDEGNDIKKYIGKDVIISPRGDDGSPMGEDIINSIQKDRALYVSPELPNDTVSVFMTLELNNEVYEGSFSVNSFVVKLEGQEL